jgi:hypothetical protein
MDISDSIASIFNAVWIAVFASRFAVAPLLREAAEDAEEDEEEDAGGRFVRKASLSAGLAGWRSFFPKSEKIPTLSLAGKWRFQSFHRPQQLDRRGGWRKITSV